MIDWFSLYKITERERKREGEERERTKILKKSFYCYDVTESLQRSEKVK